MFNKLLSQLKYLSVKYDSKNPNYLKNKIDNIYDSLKISDHEYNINSHNNLIQLNYLSNKYEFIEQLIDIRVDAKNSSSFIENSNDIINNYLNLCYESNIYYSNDIFKSKDYSVARNIVSKKRKDIVSELDKIFYNIEVYVNKKINETTENKYKNNSKKKSGRQYSEYIELALKCLLLQKFIPEERISNKYQDNNELFFKDITNRMKETKQDFNGGSFRTTFYKIYEDIESELKHRPEYVTNLLKDQDLVKNKKIKTYLKKFNNYQ